MSLRPAAANWFELLVLRDDLAVAMDALAKSRRVELQSHGQARAPMLMPECRGLLEAYDDLERRYLRHWPAPNPHPPDERDEPHRMLQRALQQLQAWADDAGTVVARLESLTGEHNDLELLRDMLQSEQPLPDLEQFSRAGPMLQSALFLLQATDLPAALPPEVITARVSTAEKTFLFAVGLPEEIASLEHQLLLHKARRLVLPPKLPATAAAAAAAIGRRLEAIDKQIAEARVELQALHERHGIADALADASFVRWYVSSVPELAATENFAWITGWTSDEDGETLPGLLADAGVKGLLRLTEAPPGFEAPLLLRNPSWMRPFELFTNMLGVPAAGGADPTRIVAIAGPLMFAYMFGDVGHGAVLLIAGLAFSRRWPALRLLTYGGAMSIVFGVLFGSVFALESVIAPLWVHPLEAPVLMLVVPMLGGAALLIVGMCLDALQACWQRRGLHWCETGAGLMLCYLALLGATLVPWLLWAALGGAVWFVVGHALVAPAHRLAAAAEATADFLESLLQLVVNTVSFVRVGAFALAHAGLSLAVVGLAETPESTAVRLLVLVLGNVLIIGLEGLVVSIQTTRLVLFEFFIRFLRAEGRPFRPLAPLLTSPPREQRRPQ